MALFFKVDDVEVAVRAVEETISNESDDGTRQKLLALMQYFRKTWTIKNKPNEWNQFRDVSLGMDNDRIDSTQRYPGDLHRRIKTTAL